MNLGSITKLKAPVAETKCNVDKGFSLYPRAEISFREGVCPGSVHPFESNSPEKKGETWPKSFTFSSLEGHSDPPPLQVPNTITLISHDRLCSVTEHAMLLRCFLELILSAKKG